MRSSPNEFQKDFWKKVGQRIISRREQLGTTRDQLSDFLQITYKGLSQIERGEHGCSVSRLMQIASTLNLSLDELIFGKHELSEHELEQTRTARDRINLLLENRTETQLNSIYHVLLSIVSYMPLDQERDFHFLCTLLFVKMMKHKHWF